MESAEEMDVAVMGVWKRGGGRADVGDVIYYIISGGTPIQVEDVVHVPTY